MVWFSRYLFLREVATIFKNNNHTVSVVNSESNHETPNEMVMATSKSNDEITSTVTPSSGKG